MPRVKKEVKEAEKVDLPVEGEEILVDNPVEKPLETPKATGETGVITLKANHPQLGGEYTRTFTNREDAEAWKKRFNAKEV